MEKQERKMIMVTIAAQKAFVEGVGECILMLKCSKMGEMAKEFFVSCVTIRKRKYGKEKCLRRFPTMLRAVRSYRRFVNLSDEVEKGYGV